MAGSNAIASGAAVLTTNADGLKSGLDKAAKDVQGWGTRVGASLSHTLSAKGGTLGGLQNLGGAVVGQLSGLAGAAKGLLSGAGGAIGMALGGPIGAAIGGAVGSAVGGLAETVVGALASPFEKIDLFKGIVKQADSLGIAAGQFQGLTQQFERLGIDAGTAQTVFTKFGAKLTDAAQFGAPAATAAFERLGLSADELSKLPLDQSFLKVASAIEQLGNPAQQAHAAISVFGKAGAELVPILQKGGAGIQAFIDQQKASGAVLGDDQLRQAAKASTAWKEAKNSIKSAWDGLVNRATVIAAPLIEFVGKGVTKLFGFLAPVFDWVGRAVSKVATVATAVFEQLTKWFDQGVKWLQQLGAELGTFTGEWPTVEEVVVGVFRALGVSAAYAWDTVKLGAGAIAFVAGAIIEQGGLSISMFRRLIDLAKELPDDIRPDWVNKMVAAVDRADDTVREFGGRVKKWGEEAVAGWGKSADDFNKWLDGALAPKAKEAGAKAGEAFSEGLAENMTGPKLSGAMLRGSKEAYSLIVKNNLRGIGTQDEPIKGVLKEAKKTAKNTEKGAKAAEKAAKVLEGLGEI